MSTINPDSSQNVSFDKQNKETHISNTHSIIGSISNSVKNIFINISSFFSYIANLFKGEDPSSSALRDRVERRDSEESYLSVISDELAATFHAVFRREKEIEPSGSFVSNDDQANALLQDIEDGLSQEEGDFNIREDVFGRGQTQSSLYEQGLL